MAKRIGKGGCWRNQRAKEKGEWKKKKLNKLLIPYHSFKKIQRLVEKCVRTTSNLIEFATTIWKMFH